MSKQAPPSPPDGDETPPRKSPDSRKPERSSSNLFWMFLIGGTVLMLVYSFFGSRMRGEEIKFSEFRRKVMDNVLDESNVYNLVIRPGYITYQDQPEV